MRTNLVYGLIAVIIFAASAWYLLGHQLAPAFSPTTEPIADTTYECKGASKIRALYYGGPSLPGNADHPPMPGGSVHLILSDSREMTLPQTLSADGARYANSDESFVFWDKGNQAAVNDGARSYTCIPQN